MTIAPWIVTWAMLLGSPDSVSAAMERAEACDFAEALRLLERAEPFQRDSIPVRLLRSRLLIQLERGDEALRVLAALPSKSEFHSEGERHLLQALAAATVDRLPLAEAELKKARLSGADADLVEGALAKIRLQAKRLDEAESVLRAVLTRKDATSMTGAIYNLAVLAALKGRDFEAAGLIRLAWHLGYRNPGKLRTEKAFARVVASGSLIDDLLTEEKSARCATW